VRVRYRVMLVSIVAAAALFGSVALTAVSDSSEGPVSGALARVGAGFGSLEHSIRGSFRGPGRSAGLQWFAGYRNDVRKLKKPDVVLFGAYDSGVPQTLDGVLKLEQSLGTTLPLIHIYTAWGDNPDENFPLELVTAISDLGSVPVITWEPWLTDFVNGKHPQLPLRDERDSHGMAAVAAGVYDFYIDAWARDARDFGKPVFVRLGHEMNDPYRYPWGPQNNTNAEYIAAWRHVVERFRNDGANNVLWVWSPHVAYEHFEQYYPGADYVDWVATGSLNYGPIAQWSKWWTFADIFGKKYPELASMGKPVMVAEFGSLAVGGTRARWYQDALDSLTSKYPEVRAVMFFNVKNDQTVTAQKVDWTINGDSAVLRTVRPIIRELAPTLK
jgi:hypothetical protein